MSQPGVPRIGERIRQERSRQGMSARALARGAGVSASLISQVETDKSQPSVSTLYAITTVLGISIGELFDAPASADGSTAAPPTPATSPAVRPTERAVLTLDSGVTWQRLGQLPGSQVDFMLVTYQPGGSSSGSGLLMRHTGVEYGYLISGELVLTLGFEELRLTAGDAISFDSTTPHRYRNDQPVPAVGVWLVIEHPL